MYYIVYGFFWLFSLLPWRVLYFASDCIYGLVFYVLKYRRDVVLNNLRLAFPEKSEKEVRTIAKKFYHNLIDTFLETIKMFSVSKKAILRRFTANWDEVNRVYDTGKSVQIHIGHNFNWEWCNVACPIQFRFPFVAVYMPMTNRLFERMFFKLRSKHGTHLLRATHMKEDFAPFRDTQYLLALAADQNPGNPANGLWFNFFGRPAPFVRGPVRGAITQDTIVVFSFIHKVKRGHYRVEFEVVETNPRSTTEEELTRRFVRYLEDVVRRYPDMWLWSHRRWKWQWKEEYGPVLD